MADDLHLVNPKTRPPPKGPGAARMNPLSAAPDPAAEVELDRPARTDYTFLPSRHLASGSFLLRQSGS